AARDQTPEAVRGLLSRELPGFGEIFRVLSFQEIGAAAMLSRALGGVAGTTVVLLMPGSTAAVRLAMEQLVLPELAHLVEHAGR
ncbi:MAG TPA: molybdopterin-binding protein, partial [Verrucomicrobiota bacterium]|nr:molybdopterin-binding protein [Verrucomicrobiota bacterium]